MKLLQRGVALALLTTFTLASETALAYEQDKTYKITVLHTNDHHGHFWRNEYGEYGLAAQKTLVDGIRKEVAAEGGSVLLLSGGDINTGVPESDLQDAEPDFRGMNLVGYDAMAIGNHEFDNPLTVLRQQEKWAKFPLLSANIYQKSTGERLFKPWALFKRQDLKIAVIGLTTDDTAKIGNPEYFTDVEFRKPADEAKLVIQELQQTEKPDIIIAATHMGHYDNGEHGSNAPGDVEMARALPAGSLAMIVGGHSQDPVCMAAENKKQVDYVPGTPCKPDQQNGIWIVQAPVLLAVDGKAVALLAVRDPLRSDSVAALQRLHKAGYRLVMLTGDNPTTANAIAKEAGIDEVIAGVLPDGKAEAIKRLQSEGRQVAMVGDGINDAPALAQADVGIAMGGGSDVAIETAAITLMRHSLMGVADALAISRATLRNMKQNLLGAFIYNSIGIPVAAGILWPFTGTLLNPVVAGAAMALSSITVVSNANRLLRFKPKE